MDDVPHLSQPEAEDHPQVIPPEQARQGEIILRSRSQRAVFLTGVIVPILILVIVVLWRVL